jgi:hypothetical protein
MICEDMGGNGWISPLIPPLVTRAVYSLNYHKFLEMTSQGMNGSLIGVRKNMKRM